jgi:hypothetical protein
MNNPLQTPHDHQERSKLSFQAVPEPTESIFEEQFDNSSIFSCYSKTNPIFIQNVGSCSEIRKNETVALETIFNFIFSIME